MSLEFEIDYLDIQVMVHWHVRFTSAFLHRDFKVCQLAMGSENGLESDFTARVHFKRIIEVNENAL
jgi:hypothetical protein